MRVIRAITTNLLLAMFVVLPFASMKSDAAVDRSAVLRGAEQLVDEFLDIDRTLVLIDSPSSYGPGLAKVEALVGQHMRSLGAEVTVARARVGPGNNVAARWRGTGHKNVLLLAHMDTVFKEDTTTESPFRIDGGRARGPGVLDDKGGIVMGLMAIRLLRELGFDNYGMLTLLVTTDEEMRSLGSRELILETAKAHDYAFILEFGSPDDSITTWRKGVGYLMLQVTGKAAHAGAEPEKGCNAVVELAHQMLQLGNLSNKEKETTVNFTLVQGGERNSIIPERARAQADIRVLQPDEFDRLESDVARLKDNRLLDCARVEATVERGRPPFPSNRDTNALVAKAKSIYHEIGLELGAEGSGGGTDGNYTASVGTATLDALGPVGGGAHTLNEYIDIDRIAPRIYLLTRLIMEVSADSR
jgi:glutamate carboxypeptidase